MRMPEPGVQRQPIEDEEEEQIQTKPVTEQITPLVQRQVEEEEEELQMKVNPSVIQHQEPEEDEILQGKMSEVVQRQPEEEEEEPLQAKFTSGLTGTLQAKTEASHVRVHHNSSKPAQLDALAYTQGQDIHVGPGQEKHLPHEGWHAVQQMLGRVKPTMQAKGVSINDDVGLEREADVMGTKALQVKRAQQATTASAHQGSTSLQRDAAPRKQKAAPKLIQRKEQSRKEINQRIEAINKSKDKVRGKLNELEKKAGFEYAPESKRYQRLLDEQTKLEMEVSMLEDIFVVDEISDLHHRALDRSRRLGKLQQRVGQQLKDAGNRLTQISKNYKLAYKAFVGTLGKGDKVDEDRQAALDLVLGAMVGAAIGAINPGGLALKYVLGQATEAAKQSLIQLARFKSRDLVEGLISESFEPLGAKLVNHTLNPQALSDTAQLGGDDVESQLENTIVQMNDLMQLLPDLEPLQQMQRNLAKQVMSVRESKDPALWESIRDFDEQWENIIQTTSAGITKPFDDLEKAIMAQPLKTSREIERALWIEWTSKLTPPYDQLNYPVVREHLKDVGLGYLFPRLGAPMTGPFSGEVVPLDDRQHIVLKAQIEWLHAHGIPANLKNQNGLSNARGIERLAKLGQSFNALEQNVAIGSRGTLVTKSEYGGFVLIKGKQYPFTGAVPPIAETGTKVVVHDIFPGWRSLAIAAAEYMKSDNYSAWVQLRDMSAKLKVKWDTYRDYPPYEYK
ncbi:MAG: DUF4157 domain-containing protein [Deltaproteobacteria bacterium]|nr:DUF4157 domain-containing protein [Deltaproteobacteria bacterium]